jgi:Methyltransferase domain
VIVGGAAGRLGSDPLWTDPQIELISCKISNSPSVTFVADAHEMPLAEGSVDRVWTQAVLEDVLEPAQVESKIQRVLGPDGLVYAQTRFMQEVDEFQHDILPDLALRSLPAVSRIRRVEVRAAGQRGNRVEMVDQVPGLIPHRLGDCMRHQLLYFDWRRLPAGPGHGDAAGLGLRPVFSRAQVRNGARTARYGRLVRSP